MKETSTDWGKTPKWFPEFLKKLNDSTRLNMLYRCLVLREPGANSLNYQCRDCGHSFYSTKITEEISECSNCRRTNLISSVKRGTPKIYENNIHDLIYYSKSQLTNLLTFYHNKSKLVHDKDCGFTPNGYYFKFNCSEKIEAQTITAAIMKASLFFPELWDFSFNWEKFNVKSVKIHQVLSIFN